MEAALLGVGDDGRRIGRRGQRDSDIHGVPLAFLIAANTMIRRNRRQENPSEAACGYAALTSPPTFSATRAQRGIASFSVPGVICSVTRSEEHTSELQSLMRTSYAVFCLKKKKQSHIHI